MNRRSKRNIITCFKFCNTSMLRFPRFWCDGDCTFGKHSRHDKSRSVFDVIATLPSVTNEEWIVQHAKALIIAVILTHCGSPLRLFSECFDCFLGGETICRKIWKIEWQHYVSLKSDAWWHAFRITVSIVRYCIQESCSFHVCSWKKNSVPQQMYWL